MLLKGGALRVPNFTKRERVLLTLMLVLFLVFILYRHLYQPTIAELTRLKVAVEEKKEVLERGSLLATGRDIEGEWQRIEESYQSLVKLLPDNKDLPTFLLQLEDALASRGVSLLSLEPLGTERRGDLALYSLRLNIRGDYGDIVDFLEGLGDFPRLLRLVELNLFWDEAGNRVQAELSLEVYYLPGTGESFSEGPGTGNGSQEL